MNDDIDLLKTQIIAYQQAVKALEERFVHDELRISQLIDKVNAFTSQPLRDNVHIQGMLDKLHNHIEKKVDRLQSDLWVNCHRMDDLETRIKKLAKEHGIKKLHTTSAFARKRAAARRKARRTKT